MGVAASGCQDGFILIMEAVDATLRRKGFDVRSLVRSLSRVAKKRR